jgi:peptidoglycan/LPS O-acetylase OafA/YrhL
MDRFPNYSHPWGAATNAMHAVLSGGWVGVDLFFVLSGFLITGILRRSKGSSGYFQNFYARRTLRIMPLYFGYLLLVCGILPALRDPFCRSLYVPPKELVSLILYYSNYLQGYYIPLKPINSLHLAPFWTLAVEEQFYLVWPFIVLLLNRGGQFGCVLPWGLHRLGSAVGG